MSPLFHFTLFIALPFTMYVAIRVYADYMEGRRG